MSIAMLSESLRTMATFYQAIKRPMMPKDALKGKIALVTGGGTGLGKAMTEMFVRCGASAFIISRNKDKLKITAQELQEKTGGKVFYQAADVRDPASIATALSVCEKELGLPHVVVNNAAGNFISPTERLSPNAFKTIVDIVLLGTANVTLEVGKRLIAAKQPASFLAISATYVNHGSGFVAPSAAAKSGVETLYQSLASEWSQYGMRFNVLAPGNVFEEKSQKFGPPNWRTGEPEELANLATYVVSDYASWLNGEVIRIDGALLNFLAAEFNQLIKVEKDQWDTIEKTIRSVKGS
ncbi:2,4-dienoyl-CoA reductase, mitochondrial-like isoform X3 [Varroa jacobsoni]|uniref:2,4-dienoyl-CoA reductase, mitochondrial-like isoform X3 n=1 Tax=Varroa jacobsoni TaxID=62625 RepID=UPI000BF96D51|nr:2,4-dienoyl-CoA reductase, mitochondrial-like isoform X3 [Varroa jacobsoni]